VASNIYGIPDAVRDGQTGLLVQSRNPGALAEAIGRLIDDPMLRQSLGKAGREYVARHYDWSQNAAQMTSIYERLTGQSPARRRTSGASA
jgi:glycosyltransferase involved in cell wall biosynthesis